MRVLIYFYILDSVGNLRSRGTVMLRLWRMWLPPSTNLMRKVLRTYLSKRKTSSNPCWRKTAGVWKPHTESQFLPCGGHCVCSWESTWESVWVCVCVIHTDNFFLVPYSLQLIMSHSEQNIPCDICSQFAYQIAYLSILKPGSLTCLSTCSENYTTHATASVSSSLSSWLSRCRLSCAEALLHPWMISFTPLTRKSTKSLNKDKMRRFLAKRKWKVKHGPRYFIIVTQWWHFNPLCKPRAR